MKNCSFVFGVIIVVVLVCLSGACKKPHPDLPPKKSIPTSVTDIDSNTYTIKRFGNILWMKENLRVTRYDKESLRSGDSIAEAGKQFVDIHEPYFKDARFFVDPPDTDNLTDEIRKSLGFLYNWSAAAGTTLTNTTVADKIQGICPNGWRLPTATDFDTLCLYLGGKDMAGIALKSTHGWLLNSGTNESGMNCYPAGLAIRNNATFVGKQSMFWSSKSLQGNNTKADVLQLLFNQDKVEIKSINKTQANSVRCVMDLDSTYLGF
jgi:uncharacterized protein (TIGR02145 family)